jgi:hypothetical protein
MGQQCSTLTFRHVEDPGTTDMTRIDSPDPIMYDLMRKSIQATAVMWNSDDNDSFVATAATATGDTMSVANVTTTSTTTSSNTGLSKAIGKRRPVGQSHLLYKNNLTMMSKGTSGHISGGSAVTRKSHSSLPLSNTPQVMSEKNVVNTRRGMESRSTGKTGSIANKTVIHQQNTNRFSPGKESMTLISNNSNEDQIFSSLLASSTTSTPSTHLKCPTRLLIRRRSLRIVEEGGGTHIYAIRYPEDPSQMKLSELSTTVASVVRQEQCPPRRKPPLITTTTTDTAGSASHSPPQVTCYTTKKTKDGEKRYSTPTYRHLEPPPTSQVHATLTTAAATATTTTKTTTTSTSTNDKMKKASLSSPSSSSSSSSSLQGMHPSLPVLSSEKVGELFAAASMDAHPKQNGEYNCNVYWMSVDSYRKTKNGTVFSFADKISMLSSFRLDGCFQCWNG